VLQLSDRVAVLFEGEVMGILPADGIDLTELGLLMAGAKRQTA
jgi:simple sugar transport system ATP-binding protein